MTQTLAEFQQKFRLDELTVTRTEHWVWSVRPGQATLGAGVVSLARFATRLGDLTPHEGADLTVMAHTVEHALAEAFVPDKINYLMLMMVDAHVHYHVLPRYAGPREHGGLVWHDPGWDGLPVLGAHADRSTPATLSSLRTRLHAALPPPPPTETV
jgi:diadenosine tetraphosphate (Ap4A) HIT family hydrolase